MRQKKPEENKRNSIIGIKVKRETKNKIIFISEREGRPTSTQINIIIEQYIENYFKNNKINWQEYKDEFERRENQIVTNT